MSWEELADFKLKTNIKLDDGLIQEALDAAVQEIQAYIFIPRRYQTTQQLTRHIITRTNLPLTSAANSPTGTNPPFLFLADRSANNIVDKDDIRAFELDLDTFDETDRNADITAFRPKYGVVDFSLALPTAGGTKTLIIEYSEAKREHENLLPLLKELNEILAVNWVFQKVPYEKLQTGISTWTINGVTVAFDQASKKTVREMNNKRSQELYDILQPVYMLFNTGQQFTPRVRNFTRDVRFISKP